MLYQRRLVIFGSAIVLSVLMTGAYIFFYQFSPLDDSQTNLILNALTVSSASLSFVAVMLLVLNYLPSDKPFGIWVDFASGLFMWMVAEIVWSYYAMSMDEVPSPGLADIFWVGGMLFFTLGMYRQYRLVAQASPKFWVIPLFWTIVMIVTYFVLLATGSEVSSENYIEYFYAVSDFGIGLIALRLLLYFNGGVFARPWIGMFVFGVSDALYAVANASGLYSFSITTGNWISLLVDTTYIIAYLFLALSFFAQYLLLRFGPEAFLPSHEF